MIQQHHIVHHIPIEIGCLLYAKEELVVKQIQELKEIHNRENNMKKTIFLMEL